MLCNIGAMKKPKQQQKLFDEELCQLYLQFTDCFLVQKIDFPFSIRKY